MTTDPPRRAWWHPPRQLTRPWRPALFTATDEHCNPTIALILPGLGMLVVCYRPGPLRTTPCPTCEEEPIDE